MEKGKLYGVSVGPGDPELVTLKAVRVLREADCIAVPQSGSGRQTALGIVSAYVQDKQVIDCPMPMTRDREALEAAHNETAKRIAAELDQGRNVAYITLGDAAVYSTYFYVHERIVARGYEAEAVPGVTSFCAAAARLGEPLCEGLESLLLVPASAGDIDGLLDVPANKVFMKAGRSIMQLKEKLAERGQLEDASLVANCGLPGEQVFERFSDVEEPPGYFALVLTRTHGKFSRC